MVNKIDSNSTGLRYAVEESLGVLGGSPVWNLLEPNSYRDFGGQITTVARNPINPTRQRKKGVTVDLDASGGFNQDITQDNSQELLEGFLFAARRYKSKGNPSGVVAATDHYALDSAEPGSWQADMLILGTGFTNAANNGLRKVSSVSLVQATGTLTLNSDAGNNETVTIGSRTYTFKTTLTGAANEVVRGVTATATLDNLIAAINGAAGAGTAYGTGTVAHADVTAVAGSGDTMDVTAKMAGTDGNAIATTETLADASSVWGDTTLDGGEAEIVVPNGLVDETPPADAQIELVGWEADSGTLAITTPGSLPRLVSTAGPDFSTLDLLAGEWIFLGGDATANQFATAVDNGWARIKTVNAGYLEFDKTSGTMVADAGTGKTIRFFMGRVLRNEPDETDIVRKSFQLERTLGNDGNGIQSEYLIGAVASELTLNVNTADKLTLDLSFVGIDNEQRDGTTGRKAGTRPSLTPQDAFNTSSDFSRLKMSLVDPANSNVTPLYAFLSEATLTINNNLSPNKAVTVLGAFDISAGSFDVGGNVTAYFGSVDAVQAVRNNSDVTLDFAITKANAGLLWDIPLLSLGEGRLNIEANQPITLPLSMTGAESDFGYTLLMMFFPYLPDAAA